MSKTYRIVIQEIPDEGRPKNLTGYTFNDKGKYYDEIAKAICEWFLIKNNVRPCKETEIDFDFFCLNKAKQIKKWENTIIPALQKKNKEY